MFRSGSSWRWSNFSRASNHVRLIPNLIFRVCPMLSTSRKLIILTDTFTSRNLPSWARATSLLAYPSGKVAKCAVSEKLKKLQIWFRGKSWKGRKVNFVLPPFLPSWLFCQWKFWPWSNWRRKKLGRLSCHPNFLRHYSQGSLLRDAITSTKYKRFFEEL